MSNFKKIIIALGITLILYGIFNYIYNTYIKEPYQNIYVLNKDLAKNEVIKEEYLEEVKTLSFLNNKKYISKDEVIKENGNIISAYSIRAGQIITKDVVVKKNEQLEIEEGYEYISLDIKSSSKGVSYQIKKGDNVNIYYTSKSKLVEGVIDLKEKIYSTSNLESDVTCKLLENAEIFGVYDSKGVNIVGASNENSNISTSFDTVIIRVNAKDAILISNLKDQGEFNLTKVS